MNRYSVSDFCMGAVSLILQPHYRSLERCLNFGIPFLFLIDFMNSFLLWIQILERKPELAKLEVVDTGKSLDEAASDMVSIRMIMGQALSVSSCFLFFLSAFNWLHHVIQDSVASCFKYYAELAEALDAKQKAPVSIPVQSFKTYVLKEPIGVVALITPWYMLLCYPSSSIQVPL